jgi:hypothetical protein
MIAVTHQCRNCVLRNPWKELSYFTMLVSSVLALVLVITLPASVWPLGFLGWTPGVITELFSWRWRHVHPYRDMYRTWVPRDVPDADIAAVVMRHYGTSGEVP